MSFFSVSLFSEQSSYNLTHDLHQYGRPRLSYQMYFSEHFSSIFSNHLEKKKIFLYVCCAFVHSYPQSVWVFRAASKGPALSLKLSSCITTLKNQNGNAFQTGCIIASESVKRR